MDRLDETGSYSFTIRRGWPCSSPRSLMLVCVASEIRRPGRPSMATSAKSYRVVDDRAAVSRASNWRWDRPIKPGRYRLVPLRLAGGPPHPQAQTVVTATAAGYTGVVLRFYTGIV
jgi:hypothetical protein